MIGAWDTEWLVGPTGDALVALTHATLGRQILPFYLYKKLVALGGGVFDRFADSIDRSLSNDNDTPLRGDVWLDRAFDRIFNAVLTARAKMPDDLRRVVDVALADSEPVFWNVYKAAIAEMRRRR